MTPITITCSNCNKGKSNLQMYEDHLGRSVCETCRDEIYSSCGNCLQLFHDECHEWGYGNNGYCEDCSNDEDMSVDSKEYEPIRELRSSKTKGKIVRSLRPFGVELETQFSEGASWAKVKRGMDQAIGYSGDGSINGNGVEFQTPPANGTEAETLINNHCRLLKDSGFTVDKSCGFHLHIDSRGVDSLNSVRSLWGFYIAFEDVLLSFLPPSRRTNHYCAPLRSDWHITELFKASSVDELEKLWYETTNKESVASAKRDKKHGSRYRGVNMHSLFSAQHLEIRYHSGTINSRKVLEWANLHCLIMDYCALSGFGIYYLKDYCNSIDVEYKTRMLFDVLGLDDKSRDYFKKRQKAFYKPMKFPENKEFIQGAQELADDNE